MLDLKELILKLLKSKPIGYGTAVDITSYNSSSNYYEAPSDGMVRGRCAYNKKAYCNVYVGGVQVLQMSSNNSYDNVGVLMTSVPVFKGQHIYCTGGVSYAAFFIPFVGG